MTGTPGEALDENEAMRVLEAAARTQPTAVLPDPIGDVR